MLNTLYPNTDPKPSTPQEGIQSFDHHWKVLSDFYAGYAKLVDDTIKANIGLEDEQMNNKIEEVISDKVLPLWKNISAANKKAGNDKFTLNVPDDEDYKIFVTMSSDNPVAIFLSFSSQLIATGRWQSVKLALEILKNFKRNYPLEGLKYTIMNANNEVYDLEVNLNSIIHDLFVVASANQRNSSDNSIAPQMVDVLLEIIETFYVSDEVGYWHAISGTVARMKIEKLTNALAQKRAAVK